MNAKSMLIIACLSSVSAFVLADDAHHPDAAAKPPAAAPAEPGGDAMARMRMRGMHEHMKVMREQMARIRAATDAKEKERLVNEHLKTMDESMSKMHGMMGCPGT